MPDVPSDPKDVVRRFFATLGTGDFAAVGEFFDDDSVWQVNDVARGLPAQRGRKGIIDDFLQPIREGLFEPGDPKIEIRSMIARGPRVAAETTGRRNAAEREPLRERVRVHHRSRRRQGAVPARVHGLRLRALDLGGRGAAGEGADGHTRRRCAAWVTTEPSETPIRRLPVCGGRRIGVCCAVGYRAAVTGVASVVRAARSAAARRVLMARAPVRPSSMADGEEDQGGGQRVHRDVVGEHPVPELRAEHVLGAVGEVEPAADDHDPEQRVRQAAHG